MEPEQEMQFGQVVQPDPPVGLRPDQNHHLTVFPCGEPATDDLPVFIDLDVMLEMIRHASSDLRVELGGVVLGGQFVDDQGEPFVVVSDCLRAEHYQATRGSFKFTHETWEAITRQRAGFPAETQMVGWYHTHPDWGVFLSSMDLFICEHFFNKPLDVAIVLDPVRDERGLFFWERGPRRQKRRASGFYLISSRLREEELRQVAATWGTQRARSPIMHFHSPGQPEREAEGRASEQASASAFSNRQLWRFPGGDLRAPWVLAALVVLLLWPMLPIVYLSWYWSPDRLSSAARESSEASESEPLRQIQALREELRNLSAVARQSDAVDAKLQVLDQLLSREQAGLPDAATQLAERQQQIERLEATLYGLDAARREAERQLAVTQTELQASRKESERLADQTRRELDIVLGELKEVKALNQEQQDRLSQLLAQVRSGNQAAQDQSLAWWSGTPMWLSAWNVMLAAGLGTLVLVGIALAIWIRVYQGKRTRAAVP